MIMIYAVRPVQSFYNAAFINSIIKAKREQIHMNNGELWWCSCNDGSLVLLLYKRKISVRSRWGVYKPCSSPAISMKMIDRWIWLYWFHLLNLHELNGKWKVKKYNKERCLPLDNRKQCSCSIFGRFYLYFMNPI